LKYLPPVGPQPAVPRDCARILGLQTQREFHLKGIGVFLAGIWFVVTGLVSLFGLKFNGMGVIMASLALIAGVMMIIQR